MTAKTKMEVRQREIRTRLSEIANTDELTDELRGEIKTLTDESVSNDAKLNALAVSADGTGDEDGDGDPLLDSEAREVLELRSRSSVISYVQAAVDMRSVGGAEAEYNQALKMGANAFPLEMLAPVEERQTTDVDSGANQGTWLDRLFNNSAAQYLGVSFQSVGPGVASFPVTTAGATAEQQAKSEASGAAAWTIGVTEMKPKRNAVHAIFSIEDAARLGPGLEAALQRDLRSALVEGLDRSIFKGDSSPSGTEADIVGFQTVGVSEFTLTQGNKVKGDKILEKLVAYIDGKHAVSPGDIKIVASVGTNVLWLTKAQAAAVENQTVAQFLRASGIGWTTRGGIDTNTSNGDFGAYLGLGQGIAGAAVAAVWESASMIRDQYSGAAKGEVGITLNTLWDFKVPRTSNFKRLKYVS